MTSSAPPPADRPQAGPLAYEAKIKKAPRSNWRDDVAYVLPYVVFLLFTQLGASFPAFYPLSYVLKTFTAALLLLALRGRYTPARWNGWWLGILVGVVGILQWVPMQLWLENHFEFFRPSDKPPGPFNPDEYFKLAAPWLKWAWIGLRVADAVIVVPIMEELFWRDYAWRQVQAPNDFKLAEVGEWSWGAFLAVSLFFATVHGNWWLTAILWAMMVGLLLAWTRSLGACILAHAATNLLLAAYVLWTHNWSLW